ncbi:oxygen-dependent protoporphyrinogen oxidase [Aspergillus tanneri]|uniref:Protoporphyrinogen oxidase n=1 Tax=Aspergillus tanneri TaxID=1220188 RepID=A0A5M9MF84_9EURO|nr:oxygen-dependent protoporphyrinogen oxidase [Aspergillus tanneri]KAA8644416.1 oxygen-dependent protoporphyrinogen oxidase [Aspergillus tanneri]
MRLPCTPSRALNRVRTPLAFARSGQRHFLHSSTYDAAVIGGGITGLTTAYRLSKDPNCSRVTLYEKSDDVGGCLQSETIPVDGGHVVFEYGPRTLRTTVPNCLPMVDLLVDLDVLDDVVATSRTAPASLNRYIYYPDHLVRVPAPNPKNGIFGNLRELAYTLFREPAFKGLVPSVFVEPSIPAPQPKKADESVADFISRRFAPEVADNLASSVFHGIYAGDIDRLSAQTLLGTYRDFEYHKDGVGVIVRAMESSRTKIRHMSMDDILAVEVALQDKPSSYLNDLQQLVRGASVLTFRNGLGQLSDALVTALTRSNKVDILTGTEVKAMHQNAQTSDITISPGHGPSTVHNRVISTIPPPHLARALRQTTGKDQVLSQSTIRSLEEHNYAVTVMAVNLYYERKDLLPVQGFGYLIPRSIPYEQNPERALGVIFGSETSIGQDTAPGTKLTVMMGGHWWDDWIESDYPDHDTAVQMARQLLHRHLGITDTPAVARSRLQRDAIPQYTVGHLSRMEELSRSTRHEFKNRLSLAGNWYNGVGVVDCIRQAYLTASWGVGAQRRVEGDANRPWGKFDYENSSLEGGIVTSSSRLARPYVSKYRSTF